MYEQHKNTYGALGESLMDDFLTSEGQRLNPHNKIFFFFDLASYEEPWSLIMLAQPI